MSQSQNYNEEFLNASLQLNQNGKEHYYYYGISPQGSKLEQIIFTCSYMVVILTGLIGNFLVIRVVKTNHRMHTTTNYLIANIAVADLITMVSCLPFVILKFYSHPRGITGKLVCTLITKNNFSCITLSVSIISLCILAVERYNALLKPMQHKRRMTKDTVLYAVFGTWFFAVMAALPLLIHTDFNQELHRCQFTFSTQAYWIAVGAVTFLILVTICYCYFKVLREIHRKRILAVQGIATQVSNEAVKNRRKLVKLLLTLTCAFVLFFVPRLVYLFFASFLPDNVRLSFRRLSFFLVVCNSCVNPIICAFQSENYRTAFKRMLGLRRRRTEAEQASCVVTRRGARQTTLKSQKFQESQF